VPQDTKSRGRRFAEEAEALLEQEMKQPSITLLQGLYALFAYEGNLGSGRKSVDYFSRAIAMFDALNATNLQQRHLAGADDVRMRKEHEATSWVLWGLYVAEWYD
jgi:hypothetical protein